jgi:two-component system nitrogen regulation response regulator GlnG
VIDNELGPASEPETEQRDMPEGLSEAVERHLARHFQSYGEDLPPVGLYHRVLREIEVPLLSAALAATRGNQIKASELLGLNRNTLRKKIRELDLRVTRRSV